MQVLRIAFLALVCGGCERGAAPTSRGAAPSTTPPAEPGSQEHEPAPGHTASSKAPDAITALARRVCAKAPCSGELAEVVVWRDQGGAISTVEHRGDLARCSHPPTVFFDAKRERLEAIPMQPVAPGSEEAKGFAAIRERHTGGMVEAETVRCGSM